MSLPKKSFFRLTLILSLVILFIFAFSLQKQAESAVQEGSEEKAKMAKYEKDFNAHLEGLFAELRANFKEGDYEKIAYLLVDRTVLFTPTGERITVKGDLLNYFKGTKRAKVIDLRFTLVFNKVFMVAEPIDKDKDTIDAIGHAIITYHLIEQTGETTTNTTGSLAYSARHPSRCVWGKSEM